MKNTLLFISFFAINSSFAQISDFKEIDFEVADNIVKLNEGSSLDNLALLAHNLTFKLEKDIEKLRAIYTWVSNNIDGDPKQENEVIDKRVEYKNDSIALLKWNNEFKKIAFETLSKHKKTMCTGYAYLIKELCFLANIECEIVDGYGRTTTTNIDNLELTNHSWNVVKLDNKWYLCDATWSSGYFDDYNIFVNDYNDGYFLTDPILFAKSHYPLEKKWLLNESLINSEFMSSPMVYGDTYKHKIVTMSPNEMHLYSTKNAEVMFSFKSLKNIDLDKISLVQFLGTREKSFEIYDLKNEDDLITFKYRFRYKKLYDVHLKIEDDIVATYTIKVAEN